MITERELAGQQVPPMVGTRLDPLVIQSLDAVAQKRGLKRSELLREFIHRGLEEALFGKKSA